MRKRPAVERNCVGDKIRGRRRGRLSTEIHVLIDALGNSLGIVLGPSQQTDCQRAADLLRAVHSTHNVLTDNTYDTNALITTVAAPGTQGVFISKNKRKISRLIDRDGNNVERFFGCPKQFGWLPMPASEFFSLVHFVAARLWLR